MFVNLLVSQDGCDKYYGKLLVENNLVLRLHIHRTIHMVLAQQEQISMATYQIFFRMSFDGNVYSNLLYFLLSRCCW